MLMRKFIHVDMDAFYASVEQRDDPSLRGKPVVVAWRGRRSVVCAASYEARRFGVHSAMPAITAERLCPEAVFVPPDFGRYKVASRQIRNIFLQHTDLVEPLSLDEAYLDVTENKSGLPTATRVASSIRQQIRDETQLTASAGVAPAKFLAKIASDWRKPNGLFVIQPHEVLDFLAPLAVERIPGVGKVMAAKLARYGIHSIGDLRLWEITELERRFGRFGIRLHELARGIDHSEVKPDRPVQSISAEDTFDVDRFRDQLTPAIRALSEKAWASARKTDRPARTVVLKLKTDQFKIITRSITPGDTLNNVDEVSALALQLLERVELPADTRFRLAGVGLSNFIRPGEIGAQTDLFQHEF